MAEWYHRVMAKRKKPDTETITLTYDELETALTALALRQEELRDAKSRDHRKELEHIWNVTDKMDLAQRNLESRMTRQVEGWLKSLTQVESVGSPAREGLMSRLSRLLRL